MDPYRSSAAAPIESPRMPRDLGMSSLGLVMVLGAFVSAGAGLLTVLVAVLDDSNEVGRAGPAELSSIPATLVGVGLVARACIGGWAGRWLLLGNPRALTAVRAAGGVALAHTAMTFALVADHPSALPVWLVVALLVGWPACYLALTQRGAVRALYARAAKRPKLLRTRDLGVDGVGVIARVLSTAGGAFVVAYAIGLAIVMGALPRVGVPSAFGIVFGVGLLLGRTLLHVRVADALRTRDTSAFLARLNGYKVMCWVLAGFTLLAILALDSNVAFLFTAIAYALAWPLTLGVYANELGRRAPDRRASRVKPSEDGGATALGILLLALVTLWAPFALFGAPSRVPLGEPLRIIHFLACAGAGLTAALGARARRAALLGFAAIGTVVGGLETVYAIGEHPRTSISGAFALLFALFQAMLPLAVALMTGVVARKLDRSGPARASAALRHAPAAAD